MRNLLLLLTLGMLYTAQAQKEVTEVLSYIEHGTSLESLEKTIGAGSVKGDALVYVIKDEIDSRKVRGTVSIQLDSLKTWYNSDYRGIGGLVANLTIPVKKPGEHDFTVSEQHPDREWGWNWDLYRTLQGIFSGFEDLNSSEGSQSLHFFESKKENLRVKVTMEVAGSKYKNGYWSYDEAYMDIKVTFIYE